MNGLDLVISIKEPMYTYAILARETKRMRNGEKRKQSTTVMADILYKERYYSFCRLGWWN